MKWVTRERAKVDRIACPWLIKKFVDKEAQFLYVPGDQVEEVAKREGATPFDTKGAELGHHGDKVSFEAIVEKYQLTDPALLLLAQIVNGADGKPETYGRPEGPGLNSIAEGFRHLGFKDDHEMLAAESVVYDALYAYCQTQVAK
jgi:hypothetical protein